MYTCKFYPLSLAIIDIYTRRWGGARKTVFTHKAKRAAIRAKYCKELVRFGQQYATAKIHESRYVNMEGNAERFKNCSVL